MNTIILRRDNGTVWAGLSRENIAELIVEVCRNLSDIRARAMELYNDIPIEYRSNSINSTIEWLACRNKVAKEMTAVLDPEDIILRIMTADSSITEYEGTFELASR